MPGQPLRERADRPSMMIAAGSWAATPSLSLPLATIRLPSARTSEAKKLLSGWARFFGRIEAIVLLRGLFVAMADCFRQGSRNITTGSSPRRDGHRYLVENARAPAVCYLSESAAARRPHPVRVGGALFHTRSHFSRAASRSVFAMSSACSWLLPRYRVTSG